MNEKELICRTIVSASTAAVPRKVAMMVRNSNAHHSLHNMMVPGSPSEMNSYNCSGIGMRRGDVYVLADDQRGHTAMLPL